MIGLSDIPVLPRGVRRHYDEVRQTEVLLGPERVLMLDEIAVVVLSRLNGKARVCDIVTDLSAAYDAPRDVIEQDVLSYLTNLAEKRFLDVRDG